MLTCCFSIPSHQLWSSLENHHPPHPPQGAGQGWSPFKSILGELASSDLSGGFLGDPTSKAVFIFLHQSSASVNSFFLGGIC